MMHKMMGSAHKEDPRDWDAIRAWATGLKPKLLGEA
jgi:hypothetical protein